MAFIPILFLYLFIAICILLVMLVTGIIILIIGLRKKKKYVGQGKKSPYILITLGSILILIPISIVGFIFISQLISDIRLKIARKGYDSCTDRWKNEWVSDSEASDEALEWIIEAAENGDKDAICSVFTEEIQNDPDLDIQIDKFIEEYPRGFSELEFDFKGGSSPGSSEDGKSINQFYYSYEVIKDGKYYYIEIGGCNENDYDSDKVGIEYFIFKSERAEVYYDDISEEIHEYSEYICADIDVEGDFETRRVWGYPWKFYDIDRTITKEEVIDAYKSSRGLDGIREKLGEPNGINLIRREVLYELEDVNGEPRYAEIGYDYYELIDGDMHICGPTQEYSEWID